MVGNVTIKGQIVGTATFDGAKISAVVAIAPPIDATVVFGRSGVTVHNQLTDRDAEDVHPIEAISPPINNSSNVYEWIRSTLLTGLAAFTDAVIVSTDTILSAFAKLQGQVNAINGRLGVLEDSYLLKYIVPVDTLGVHLTLDKNGNPLNFIDGDSIKIIIRVPLFSIANRVNLRINNRSDNIYIWHTTLNPFSYLPPTLSNALSHYSITDLELTGGDVVFSTVYRYNTETNASSGAVGGATVGLNSGITSLYFFGSTASIPAGAIIIIKKK